MIKGLLFGQYKYKASLVHSIDPRLKLAYVIILSIMIFTVDNFSKILIFSFFTILIVLFSKISFKDLVIGLRPFFFIFAFLFAMYAIFSREMLWQGTAAIWRFLMLISMSFILTYTTQLSGLIASIESLLKPLKIFGIKPRNIAVTISIAIRFVPVMLLNLERLNEAMLSRLADFRKLGNIKTLVIVLLERMLKSASNLSEAMQSRLYNEDAESSKILKLKKSDYMSGAVVLLLVLVIY